MRHEGVSVPFPSSHINLPDPMLVTNIVLINETTQQIGRMGVN